MLKQGFFFKKKFSTVCNWCVCELFSLECKKCGKGFAKPQQLAVTHGWPLGWLPSLLTCAECCELFPPFPSPALQGLEGEALDFMNRIKIFICVWWKTGKWKRGLAPKFKDFYWKSCTSRKLERQWGHFWQDVILQVELFNSRVFPFAWSNYESTVELSAWNDSSFHHNRSRLVGCSTQLLFTLTFCIEKTSLLKERKFWGVRLTGIPLMKCFVTQMIKKTRLVGSRPSFSEALVGKIEYSAPPTYLLIFRTPEKSLPLSCFP